MVLGRVVDDARLELGLVGTADDERVAVAGFSK